MRSFRWTSTAVLLLAAMTAACQDLDVVNTNAPDRERAQSDPDAVYALIGSTYASIHDIPHHSSSHYLVMPLVADEFSGTYANAGALELSSEPRVAFNNDPTSLPSGVARYPWEYSYEAISNAVDVLSGVNDGLELIIGSDEEDFTERAVFWSLFNMAMGHAYLGALYDRAFIQTPEMLDVELNQREMVPYPEVQAAAIDMFDEAIAYAEAHPDVTIPAEGWFWEWPADVTMPQMIEIMNHTVARFMVYGARTPEERENLDWNEVIRRLDNGVSESVWVYAPGSWSRSNNYYQLNEGSFISYGDARLIGPADISGGYQNWLSLPWAERDRWDITTPDLRFPQSNTHGTDGLIWEYDASSVFSPERGLYHRTWYQWEKIPNYYNIDHDLIPIAEADLMRAEARYFLGDRQGAADLVNITRVANGLPPVTVDGAPGGPGACVPHKATTTQQCGDLYEALMYERMQELSGQTSNRGYLDSRGFGRLQEGTFLHLPVPGRELGSLRIDIYSFGGVGGPGAAAAPVR